MDLGVQREKAESFRRMHDRKHILPLPNAWDAASARVFEQAGFKAVATTSAGVSHCVGYPDGQVIPRDEMITMIRWIARAVSIPVTADMESGFGRDANDVTETVRMVIAAGAVGINLEDSVHGQVRKLYELPVAIERLRAAREAANAAQVPIVINARTDVFLLGSGEQSAQFDEAARRLNAYREAGADCLYPIGFLDAETIERLAKAINGPINVIGMPGVPPTSELERLGVARVSTASGPARVALTTTHRIAEQLMRDGSFEIFGGDTISGKDANALFAKREG
jgi:2-methylisocitrate lyase-like PEP mutase family enzyme